MRTYTPVCVSFPLKKERRETGDAGDKVTIYQTEENGKVLQNQCYDTTEAQPQNRESQCWKQKRGPLSMAHRAGMYMPSGVREEQDPLDPVCTVSQGWVQGTPRSTCWPTCPSRFSASQQVLGPRALLSSVTCFRYFHSGRTWVAKCHLKWRLIRVWPWVLLLQQRDSLLEHPHLGLVSLHHGHHLRLQLLQFVLMFLLCFLIGSH